MTAELYLVIAHGKVWETLTHRIKKKPKIKSAFTYLNLLTLPVDFFAPAKQQCSSALHSLTVSPLLMLSQEWNDLNNFSSSLS